jgi:hypothetical protein
VHAFVLALAGDGEIYARHQRRHHSVEQHAKALNLPLRCSMMQSSWPSTVD